MNDYINRQDAIDAIEEMRMPIMRSEFDHEQNIFIGMSAALNAVKKLPSVQPDFSCEGCQTPKHICGICMRNYPNITDHYTGGEEG